MSKESEIMREHIRTHRTVLSMCNEPEDVILNRLLDDFDSKDQRIAELEEQVKKAIVPKFKVGQEVWFVNELSEEIHLGIVVGFEVSQVYFSSLDSYYRIEYEDDCLITDDFEDEFVFATKEEAQAKLEELKGE